MVTPTGVATNPHGLLRNHGNYGMIGLGSAPGTPRLDKISSRQHLGTHNTPVQQKPQDTKPCGGKKPGKERRL
jgi:hypothetical protein